MGQEDAEKVRKIFLENGIQVRQITNLPELPAFSENDEFVNTVMSFRYVPAEVFSIKSETVIFDDTCAIYNPEKETCEVIVDAEFAAQQKQLFENLWETQGLAPTLGFPYTPNHSFYNNIDFFVDGKQLIVWPDADARSVYHDLGKEGLEQYLADLIKRDWEYYADASYVILFLWAYEGDKMADVWKFNENHVDDRSGPLGDVRVYRDGKVVTDIGLASGNTLMVLGYEERLRRQSKDLGSYLDGPVPKLPLEVCNGEDFF